MGGLGGAISFDRYVSALAQEAAMGRGMVEVTEVAILGALGAAALLLFVLMFVRRSGTAAAGFALVALTALAEAMLFGRLDFITPGTALVVATLTACALLLFVNAVLHTGRENVVVAALSAFVIAGLLGLAGFNLTERDFGRELQLGLVGSSLLSAGLLVFAMVRDVRGKGFLGLSVLLSLLSVALMLDPVVPLLDGGVRLLMPAVLVAAGILMASLAAPFLADEMRVPSRRERMAAAATGMVPASLFADDDMPVAPRSSRRGAVREPAHGEEEAPAPWQRRPGPVVREASGPNPFAAANPFARPDPVAEAGAETYDAGTASNYWRPETTGGLLAAEADEYVWDALANPEVRCGDDALAAFGADRPEALAPEGLRERLVPEALATFDEEVLGGADPESGRFDVELQTAETSFRFHGRRKVDHEGLLMRVEGTVTDIRRNAGPAPAAGGAVMALAAPEGLKPVARLGDGQVVGIDLVIEKGLDPDTVKARVDGAAAGVAAMLREGHVKGPFAAIDATSAELPRGLLAAAIGKAVRVHELPRRALVVGLALPGPKQVKAFSALVADIQKAGGGVALVIEDAQAKPVKGLTADMLWVSAMDVLTERRSRRSAIEQIARRFSVPVLVRDLQNAAEARRAGSEGALFGSGRAFADLRLPSARSGREERPQGDTSGGLSALRANGLR